jgi:tetratricopeptide (TPR) repeat protein
MSADTIGTLIETLKNARDVEERIAAIEKALALEPRIAEWPPGMRRDVFKWNFYCSLGDAYSNRESGDRSENLDRAILAYESAIILMSPEENPLDWALAKSSLGIIYRERLSGIRSDNIEKSIVCLKACLPVFKQLSNKDLEWGRTQNELGTAYIERLVSDQAQNIENALAAYEQALTVFDKAASPEDWAETQDNIGTAYRSRLRGDPEQNQESSIGAFREALTIYSADAYRNERAATFNNLGLTYLERELGVASQNIEEAIKLFRQVIHIISREEHPIQWAGVQNNLANAYCSRSHGQRRWNLERAIHSYEAAAPIYQEHGIRIEWAKVQTNLGTCYWDRLSGRRSTNIDRAIEAYKCALSVFSLEAFPRDHLRVSRYLGQTLSVRHDWKGVLAAFESARAAFTELFGQGLDDDEAQLIVAEAGPTFSEAAYAAIELGDLKRAIELLNDGKARLVAAALRRQGLPLTDGERLRVDQLRTELRALLRTNEELHGEERAQLLSRIADVRRELNNTIESALTKAGVVGGNVGQILASLDPNSAIVAPLAGARDGKLLVIKGGPESYCSVVDLPQLTSVKIEDMIRGDRKNGAIAGWLRDYKLNEEMAKLAQEMRMPAGAKQYRRLLKRYQRAMKLWLASIERLAHVLWKLLAKPLISQLEHCGIKPGSRIYWMPNEGLGILPICVAYDPVGRMRFGDAYEVVYVPCLESLAAARTVSLGEKPTLAAFYPSGGLASALFEAEIIADHFDSGSRKVIREKVGLEEALTVLKNCDYWHFATHGLFDWKYPQRSHLELPGGAQLTVAAVRGPPGLRPPPPGVL